MPSTQFFHRHSENKKTPAQSLKLRQLVFKQNVKLSDMRKEFFSFAVSFLFCTFILA